jgi:hypothetical protein
MVKDMIKRSSAGSAWPNLQNNLAMLVVGVGSENGVDSFPLVRSLVQELSASAALAFTR